MATNVGGFLEQHRKTIDDVLWSPENVDKSPVSLLMELGALMKIPVSFRDTEQTGLSHQKMFSCETRMGQYLRCTGTAHSKKEAKKISAEQAIRKLKSHSKIGEKKSVSKLLPSQYSRDCNCSCISEITYSLKNMQRFLDVSLSSWGWVFGKNRARAIPFNIHTTPPPPPPPVDEIF